MNKLAEAVNTLKREDGAVGAVALGLYKKACAAAVLGEETPRIAATITDNFFKAACDSSVENTTTRTWLLAKGITKIAGVELDKEVMQKLAELAVDHNGVVTGDEVKECHSLLQNLLGMDKEARFWDKKKKEKRGTQKEERDRLNNAAIRSYAEENNLSEVYISKEGTKGTFYDDTGKLIVIDHKSTGTDSKGRNLEKQAGISDIIRKGKSVARSIGKKTGLIKKPKPRITEEVISVKEMEKRIASHNKSINATLGSKGVKLNNKKELSSHLSKKLKEGKTSTVEGIFNKK